jgi:hypothetical protein
MEYLAVVRLCALIAQEAEVEQAKAQEVMLKKAINKRGTGTNEAENQNKNMSTALIKVGEIPAPPQVPVLHHPSHKAYQGQKPSRPPFYCESAVTLLVIQMMSSAMCSASLGLQVWERLLWVNQLLVPSVDRSSTLLLVVCMMRPRYRVTIRLTSPVDLVCSCRCYTRQVI